MPRSSTTESYSSSIFSFLRNLHTAFHSGCTNLHSDQQHIRAPVLPHPHQYLLLLLPLNMIILTEVKWNLSGVLIWICFIAREVEHFFMYLMAIYTSSFENSLLIYVTISSLGCWFFGGLSCFERPIESRYLFLIRWVAGKIFYHSVVSLLSLVTFFCCAETF
jgi:hypothetical protein